MATKTAMTAEEFLVHSTDAPCELVCGEMVETVWRSVRHGIVCVNVGMILRTWSRKHSIGFVAVQAGVITQRDPDSVRCPDCLFIHKERIPGGISSSGFLPTTPDLAVEVLSEGDRWSEVIAKVGEYLEAGVREVWILNPELSQVQVFRPDQPPTIVEAADELTSPVVLPSFRCRVSEIFAEM